MVMIGMMLIVAARWVQLSERGVRVGLRILVTKFRQKALPGLGPGASNDVSVWRLLVLA
jgi:hypothetical protein